MSYHGPPGSGYPPPGSGYPPSSSGYPPPGSGYPPSSSGYPPPGSGYPPPGSGYPPSGSGYPPPGSGYPPPSAPGYPPPGSGYPPPAGSGYPYGGGQSPYMSATAPPYGSAPPPSAPYGGSPFAALVPSTFPPGTDPNVVACFEAADRDRSGSIDDYELQSALSAYNQGFSIRTVHLLMHLFAGSSARRIGPKEFTSLFYGLQNWRGIFERFDRDRSGKIDANELREALLNLGFSVSPMVLDLLVSKFDKSGGLNRAIEYDHFIECCLTVKGLTEKFKEKDTMFTGTATFSYEAFMLTVIPFIVA